MICGVERMRPRSDMIISCNPFWYTVGRLTGLRLVIVRGCGALGGGFHGWLRLLPVKGCLIDNSAPVDKLISKCKCTNTPITSLTGGPIQYTNRLFGNFNLLRSMSTNQFAPPRKKYSLLLPVENLLDQNRFTE